MCPASPVHLPRKGSLEVLHCQKCGKVLDPRERVIDLTCMTCIEAALNRDQAWEAQAQINERIRDKPEYQNVVSFRFRKAQ